MTDATNRTTSFSYDGFGRLVRTSWAVSSTSTCRTTASCAGTADETRTSVAYEGGNSRPVSTTVAAGDGSVSATTAVGYDAVGNVVSVDGPLAGPDDTTTTAYDVLRRPVVTVGPDPDGGGPRRRRAARLGYDGLGRETTREEGVSDAGGANFAAARVLLRGYDAGDRVVREEWSAGGAAYAVTGYGYDAVGRPVCVAVRMDPGQWGGQSDACAAQTGGPNGPDRVTTTAYDDAGRPLAQVSGSGTAAASTEQRSYTANGQVASVTDGNGNVTSYGYDGLDRLRATTFPDGSFEQLAYDAGSNVTSRRLRDGQVIGYGWDALGRLVSKDRPGSEADARYGWDLAGRLVTASDTAGHAMVFEYDALGRQVADGQAAGTMRSGYDAAGRRVRLAWPDGTWATYEYDAAGQVTAIRDGAAGLLARYAYDDEGRRVEIVRGNGTTTSYGWDGASRLASLAHDVAGTDFDERWNYGYNPAGQIASRTGTNDAYAYSGAATAERTYAANALNQYTGVTTPGYAPLPLGYDGRGNLTVSGSDRYGYDAENRLASASVGGTTTEVRYDPVGRLDRHRIGTATLEVLYEGGQVVGERFDDGRVVRFVPGPWADERAAWIIPGVATMPAYYHADERGSVVATSLADGSGNLRYRYDEYGVPQDPINATFGYTGQVFWPWLGLWDYKARMYSPTLGRFLQTDPIGYADGLNWYDYVGGDPVNNIDPWGLQEVGVTYCPPGLEWQKDSRTGGHCVVGGQQKLLRMIDSSGGGGSPLLGGPLTRSKDDEQQSGCSAAKAAQLAKLNGIASNLGPVAFDSASERSLLAQYFRGDTTPYRLSGAEMAQARAYVGTYGNSVLGSTVRAGAGGTTERSVFFGKFASDAPLLDGLLGTATGVFRGGNLVGIRDTFNFDFKDRGGYPYGTFANAGVAMIRADAATCAGNVSIPVTGG